MDFRRVTRVYGVVCAVVALIGGLAFVGPVSAQTPTASIVGTVLDPQGLPVEGANVTLTNQGTNYTYLTTTSSTGAFQFSSIDSGLYRVSVSTASFREAVVANIKMDASTNYSVPPIRLEVGPSKQTITVEAGAEVVNTTDTEVSSTVEKKQIEDLPILDRNPLNLLGLEAGVNNSGPNGPTTTVISGQRTTYSNLTLDGINIQDNFIRENGLDFSPNLPFSSQVQEFTIVNQNSGAENGGGSSQVSIVTPKGTNNWHGQGFWNYRTNGWAANDWFNDASGVPNSRLVRNQGGGNLGGPIKKDKLFVYGYYELLRLKQEAPNITTVISPDILAALSGPNPTLPFTFTPFDAAGNPDPAGAKTVDLFTTQTSNPNRKTLANPNAPLPPATIFTADPTMLALVQQIPANKANNTRVGDGVNLLGYQLNARSDNTLDNTGVRVDYNLNLHNTISGTFAWNRQVVDRPDIDTSFNTVPLVQNNDTTKFLSLSWRWSPTGTITNEARFGFNLAPATFTTGQKFGSFVLDDTTLPFTDPNPNFLPQGRNTRTWTGLDNATFTKGNHTIKFGGSVNRITIATANQFGFYPSYALGFSDSNPEGYFGSDFLGSTSAYRISTADRTNAVALAAAVAGILDNVTQTFNATSQTSGFKNAPEDRNYRQNQYAIYAADSWRVNPRLTLSYGLRWDYYGPVDERDGLVLLPEIPQGTNINQVLLGNATVNFAGGNSPRGLYGGYWKAFSPNIGIAWDPKGNGKTAVRAGYSLNYVNDEFFTAANNAAAGNTGLSTTNSNAQLFGPTVTNPLGANVVAPPPFQVPIDFNTNALNATNSSGFIGNLAGYGIDPHLKPPQIQQWNLSVQRDIGWNTSVQVSYVGNHGVGLFRAIDVNQLNFNATAVCNPAATAAGVPCPTNTFFQDFQDARARGFASLTANGTFDPAFGCSGDAPGSTCLPFFNYIYGGAIGNSTVNTLIQQGQIGQLISIYHQNLFDTSLFYGGTGTPPGPGNLVNWFPNPFIMGGDLLKNTSSSTYHAGSVEVRRRFSRGVYFQANYTFSKVMTDFAGSQSQFQPFQDNARPGLEKARAPFDLTHAFKANFTYELPIGRGHRLFGSPGRALGLLVNGWQTGSIFTWQSGAPFSIVSQYATFNRGGSRSYNNTAVATLTHQQISGDVGTFKQTNGQVFIINPILVSPNGTGAPTDPQLGGCTPAVTGGFCNPQPGEVGNLQSNAFNAPSYFDWNMSASKMFDITEKVKLQFRTDAFNLTNHPVFAVPVDPNSGIANFNINDPRFGQSTKTISQPRVLQMQLMLTF
ncbi:MAG TPA: TonB-dependent receptor [Candidatus Limnocylindrales bacterium]|nr:TonB-dependent receptor [Candidatus Limnocylindrales bacterium]